MTISTIFQIEIPRRSTECFHCIALFTPGMVFNSVLKDSSEKGVYVRQDYCSTCWKKLEPQISREAISTWKSKVLHKKSVSNLPLQRDERAMFLLKEAIKDQNNIDCSEVFVLAIYLARKRLIHWRHDLILDDGQQASIYEISHTEEMLCIKKVPLSSLNIEEIQYKLAAKMMINHESNIR